MIKRKKVHKQTDDMKSIFSKQQNSNRYVFILYVCIYTHTHIIYAHINNTCLHTYVYIMLNGEGLELFCIKDQN